MFRTCCRDGDSSSWAFPLRTRRILVQINAPGCFREPAPTPSSPSPAQPSPAQPCRCLVSYLVLPGVCLLSPSLEGRCLLGPPACPLRSSGVVSLLEPELSDALISFGQKSPFCKMLALSPYIPRAHTHTHTRTHTHTHTHTHGCVFPSVCVCEYLYVHRYTSRYSHART